jgi:hypothetical protein
VWLDVATGLAGIVAVAAVVTAFRVPRQRAACPLWTRAGVAGIGGGLGLAGWAAYDLALVPAPLAEKWSKQ